MIKNEEVRSILQSEQFQMNYIRTVLDFLETHPHWTMSVQRWQGSIVIESPLIEFEDIKASVEIMTAVNESFDHVIYEVHGIPGKLYAQTRIEYPAWPNSSIVSQNKLKSLQQKLASLKLGKIAMRSNNDVDFLKIHFNNFCRNAFLEMQKRIES